MKEISDEAFIDNCNFWRTKAVAFCELPASGQRDTHPRKESGQNSVHIGIQILALFSRIAFHARGGHPLGQHTALRCRDRLRFPRRSERLL
jgi:hypothetical protein